MAHATKHNKCSLRQELAVPVPLQFNKFDNMAVAPSHCFECCISAVAMSPVFAYLATTIAELPVKTILPYLVCSHLSVKLKVKLV